MDKYHTTWKIKYLIVCTNLILYRKYWSRGKLDSENCVWHAHHLLCSGNSDLDTPHRLSEIWLFRSDKSISVSVSMSIMHSWGILLMLVFQVQVLSNILLCTLHSLRLLLFHYNLISPYAHIGTTVYIVPNCIQLFMWYYTVAINIKIDYIKISRSYFTSKFVVLIVILFYFYMSNLEFYKSKENMYIL